MTELPFDWFWFTYGILVGVFLGIGLSLLLMWLTQRFFMAMLYQSVVDDKEQP